MVAILVIGLLAGGEFMGAGVGKTVALVGAVTAINVYAALDQDEGPQRGSGRPIPPLVSKIRSQPQTEEPERKAA